MIAGTGNPSKIGGHRPPGQDLSIRDAVEADLPAIVEIYNAAIRARISTAQLEPVSIEERLPWFRKHSPESHPLWVAEIEGKIAAWLSFHSFMTRCAYRGTAEISVYVSDKFRRLGVGRALLERAVARSPRLEINVLVGCIFGHNEPSLRLFERLGFERWGFLPRVARVDDVERDLVIVGRSITLRRPRRDESRRRDRKSKSRRSLPEAAPLRHGAESH